MMISAIHKKLRPVQAYAKWISEMRGEPFSVVTVVGGSGAWHMGYRFVAIPDRELDYYQSHGSKLIEGGSNVAV